MKPGHHRTFLIGPCLGRGGFGEVYEARMRSVGGVESKVAVKVLRTELDIHADAVRRLRDEGTLLARLDHPTILKVFDMVILAGRVAMITELVDGADLSELHRGPDRLGLRALLQITSRVAAALDAAWSTPGPSGQPLELVHRDIKPPNIRVGRHGEVKLLDFGIAHFQAIDREAKTASDVVVGSLPYMAPERFVDRTSRPASDVYGLGCSLFEGLAGTPFLHKANLARASAMALDGGLYQAFAASRLATLPEDTPAGVRDLLTAMLAHDPADRPAAATVSARCDELADAAGGPSLRAWARERRWEAPREPVDGALQGQTITEGTLDAMAPPRAVGAVRVVTEPDQTVELAGPSQTTWVADRAPSSAPTLPPAAALADPAPKASWAPWLASFGCAALFLAAGVTALAVGALTAGWFTVFR